MPEVQLPADDEGHSDQVTAQRRTKSFFKIGLEVVLISAGVFLGLLGEEWRENAEHQPLPMLPAIRRQPTTRLWSSFRYCGGRPSVGPVLGLKEG